jgi:peptidoglycan/LPS O-acetylase OafA/YrhL
MRYRNLLTKFITSRTLWTLFEALTIGLAFYLVNALGNTVLVSVTPLVFAALIGVFAFEKGMFSRVLSHRFFLMIGALSYSIYMIHAFISWKVINTMVEVLARFSSLQITTVVDGQKKLGLEYWQGDIITAVYLAVIIGISYLSYNYFEVPCRNYFKKMADGAPRAIAVEAEGSQCIG